MNPPLLVSGIENPFFGALLGLWTGYLAYSITPSDSGVLPPRFPPLVGYLLLFFTFLVVLLRVAFSQTRLRDRLVWYTILLVSAFFGATGINGASAESALLPSWVPYLGLGILAAWLVSAEAGAFVSSRQTSHGRPE